MRECPNCSAQVSDQDVFCSECGARIPGGPAGPARADAAVTDAVPERAAPAGRKFPLPLVVIGGVAVLVVLIACGVPAFILVNRSRSTGESVFLGASSTPPATRPRRVSTPIVPPIFEETFDDDAGEWSVWEDEHGTKGVEDGVYYITVSDTGWASWGTSDRTFDDFGPGGSLDR